MRSCGRAAGQPAPRAGEGIWDPDLVGRLRGLQALPSVPATAEKTGTGETVEQSWHRQDDAGKRQMLMGILRAYYHPGWRGEGAPTDAGIRFTSGGLTPPEAVKKLRHAA